MFSCQDNLVASCSEKNIYEAKITFRRRRGLTFNAFIILVTVVSTLESRRCNYHVTPYINIISACLSRNSDKTCQHSPALHKKIEGHSRQLCTGNEQQRNTLPLCCKQIICYSSINRSVKHFGKLIALVCSGRNTGLL
jgi:hypothetical protein